MFCFLWQQLFYCRSGFMTARRYTILVRHQPLRPTQSGHPSVGRQNHLATDDGLPAKASEENGTFCVTVGPVTRTAGILVWVKSAGC